MHPNPSVRKIAELYDMIKLPNEEEAKCMDGELRRQFANLEMKKKILNGLGASVAELTQEMYQFQQYVFRKFVRPSRAQVWKLQYQHDELDDRLHNLRKFCANVTSSSWTPPRPETNPNQDTTNVPHEKYHSEDTRHPDEREVLESIEESSSVEPIEELASTEVKEEDFEKSESFSEMREGWEFKTGSLGTGYYRMFPEMFNKQIYFMSYLQVESIALSTFSALPLQKRELVSYVNRTVRIYMWRINPLFSVCT